MEDNKKQPYNVDSGVKNIHTYVSDMADAVRQNEASVIKIALAEKEKKEQEETYKEAETTNTSKFFYVLGSIILILIACLGVYIAIQKKNKDVAPIISDKTNESIISYDSNAVIDVTTSVSKKEIVDLLSNEISKTDTNQLIKLIDLTKKENDTNISLSLNNFLSSLKLEPPNSLIRALGEKYMVGTYYNKVDNKNNLFIILPINDYNLAYASMLEWEKLLLDNTFDIFNINLNGNEELLEKPWNDIMINNKDARVLYNQDGKDILYYIFIDKNNLIITTSKDAIKEIGVRLVTKQIKQI